MAQAKNILLLGGGHSHVILLKHLSRLDSSKITVTLISESENLTYSGLIPAYMAGKVATSSLQFNLKNICRRYGFQFVESSVEKILKHKNQVVTADGKIWNYDICSVNLGIKAQKLYTAESSIDNVIYLKPIAGLIKKWDQCAAKLAASESQKIVIVGGGAAAFEVATACRLRFPNPKTEVKIISGLHRILQNYSNSTRHLAIRSLEKNNILIMNGQKVDSVEKQNLTLSGGDKVTWDTLLVATTAAPLELFKNSNLPVDHLGFVTVDQRLLVTGHENLFAVGDCSTFVASPLPKAGVFAVRQAPVLFKNILELVSDKKASHKYTPQSKFLSLLLSGKKTAIASYGQIAVSGWWVYKLKYYIDQKFMTKFQ